MEWNFDFHIAEWFSHLLDWLDIIGPNGRTLLDIFLAFAVGGLSLLMLVLGIKGRDQ